MSAFLVDYSIVSLVVAFVDVILAIFSFSKKSSTGKWLGLTCVAAACVDLSYLGSVWAEKYFVYSSLSSVYFVAVDFTVISLLVFTVFFTKRTFSKLGRRALWACQIYFLVEIIIFAINPFYEFVIRYIPRNTEFAKYSYDMFFLYNVHLLFCYCMIAVVVTLLVHKMIIVPAEYKRQYIFSIIGIASIVAINGVFLFLPGLSVYNFLDYSILGYSVGIYVLYWACFRYSASGMMNLFKISVFENIDQGLVLFDRDNKLILHNDMAVRFWSRVKFNNRLYMEDFLQQSEINLNTSLESCVIQCYVKTENTIQPVRCDYRTLRNAKNRVLGHLFMFSNAVLATDPLTGFYNWENFKFQTEEKKDVSHPKLAVAICDIMGLSLVNGAQGAHMGDQKIKELSDLFRSHFTENAYFVRGQDAVLIALCSNGTEAETLQVLEKIETEFSQHVQYAVSECEENGDILKAIAVAEKGLKQKKLMNKESSHSVILNSLVQALQECDSDTEEHVRRTQMMGAELGKRIGLTDVQQSDLSLLCLLHDIGKIGVPLEILNKPGKLSADEWRVLRSHATKGYQIAKSATELSSIAEMILHHHERWDGKGYPDGLSRETIPLLSRIIAVVDAYDAMVNDRSYRPALPQEVAIEELKRCAGSQFDPSIVSEFIQLVESMPKIAAKAKDASPETKKMVREELEEGGNIDAPSFHSVHALPFSSYIIDEQQNIVSVDASFVQLTGYTQEDVEKNHMNHLDLIPPEDRMEYVCQMTEKLAKNPSAFFEHRLLCKDGTALYVFCYGRQYFDSAVRAGRAEIILASASDTYALRVMADMEKNRTRMLQSEWENAYRKDPLTGLLNRSSFKSDVEFKLLEGKTKVMMLMLDVDHFKEYNDSYGHKAGDEFLALAGQALTSSLRHNDIAGRMGGDEFAAALFFKKECTDEFMYERAQQIFDKINMTLKVNSAGTSLSMGAVIANDQLKTFNELYESADKFLYKSKELGRSKLSVSR